MTVIVCKSISAGSMLILWVIQMVKLPLLSQLKFTQFGVFLTLLASIASCLVYPDSERSLNSRNHPCKRFKCYVILWYAAVVLELAITVVFWTFMSNSVKGDAWRISLLILIHTLPIFVLFIDYILFSAIPCARRHICIIAPILTSCALVNFIYSLTVQRVYKNLDWLDPTVIFFLICLILGMIWLIYVIETINQKKLRRLGYSQFVNM